MRYLYIFLFCILFLVPTGCGLVTFPSKQVSTDSNPATQQKQSIAKQHAPMDKNKQPTQEKTIFNRVNERIITVVREDEAEKEIPTKVMTPVKIITSPEDPKDGNSIEPTPPSEDETKENEETEADAKYEEAKKKAAELVNTKQTVSSDQGNVYQNPKEDSSVLLQIVKNQSIQVDKTEVDKEDAEIWCYVTGNNGQQDFTGWISYKIIEQVKQP
jgi:hypothetical protein